MGFGKKTGRKMMGDELEGVEENDVGWLGTYSGSFTDVRTNIELLNCSPCNKHPMSI